MRGKTIRCVVRRRRPNDDAVATAVAALAMLRASELDALSVLPASELAVQAKRGDGHFARLGQGELGKLGRQSGPVIKKALRWLRQYRSGRSAM